MSAFIRSFGWNLSSQLATGLSALVIMPLAVHRLGLSAYGVWMLAITVAALLQEIDGGLTNAAFRYLSIATGAGDRKNATSLFTSIALAAFVFSTCLGAALFVAAPLLPGLFNIGGALSHPAQIVARLVAVMVPLGVTQGVAASLLQAHGRYRVIALINIPCRIAYVTAVLVLVPKGGGGLVTLTWISLGQQAALLLLLIPATVRLISPGAARLVTRPIAADVLRYGAKVQAFALAGLVNSQLDTVIVGAALPIRYAGLYGTGATVAAQLRAIPLNAATPLITRVGQALGRSGPPAARAVFADTQAVWSSGSAAFLAITGAGAVFGLPAWLGHRFIAAGVVCALLTAGNLINGLTAPLTIYLQVLGRPEVEVRYGIAGAALNLMLTLGFLWLGMYAVAGATAVAQLVSSVVLLSLARRALSEDIPSFLRPVRWSAVLIAALLAAGLEGGLQVAIPGHGIAKLCVVSLGMLPAGGVYLTLTLGLRRCGTTLLRTWSRTSSRPPWRAAAYADAPPVATEPAG